jgi:NADH-quinone oxidoreductase subunit L
MILAGATLFLGFGEGAIAQFLSAPAGGKAGASHHGWLPFTAIGISAAAVWLAWIEFGRRGAAQVGFIERAALLHALFSNRWYIDRAYRLLLDRVVYRVFSTLCARNDQKVIDGAVDGLGQVTAAAGGLMSILHAGMLQYRLIVVFVSIVLMAIYFFV